MKNLYAAWIYTDNQNQNYINLIMKFARDRYMSIIGISNHDVIDLMHSLSAHELDILIVAKQIVLSKDLITFCSRKGISIIRFEAERERH